jgi:uncharacterized spore protein YtfJ
VFPISTEVAAYFGGGGGGVGAGSTPVTIVLSEETVDVVEMVELEVPNKISSSVVRNQLRGSSLCG